ncbi:classical arabinogalactan protein 26-like [Pyrus ussuriensis x Pyrus communis]|uniref:Classical arabinogalactan protein 26-like n=1 Tax=Pyrus ussuriensis x Pyrus communis TaxID=2448454 RepID=A0A5N5FUC0_9ROSA|nr:classical arabinogalactan protein 26-like [Pyrus ussuriensis x Pyrus communis]
MASDSSLALQSQPETQFSSISAAPAFLPGAPLSSSPTLSPDISPLFPSPGGVPLSPSESPLPTIPSSQSPPDPDVDVAHEPDLALAPSGSLPVSHAVSVTSSLPINVMFFLGLLVWSGVLVELLISYGL